MGMNVVEVSVNAVTIQLSWSNLSVHVSGYSVKVYGTTEGRTEMRCDSRNCRGDDREIQRAEDKRECQPADELPSVDAVVASLLLAEMAWSVLRCGLGEYALVLCL
jgi:hypothetical protein